MSSPVQAAYVRYLVWETRLHILLIACMVLAAVSPVRTEAIPVVLIGGMILRTRSCGVLPRSSIIAGPASVFLFPLWPVLVTHDTIWQWMEREGFGKRFRAIVTATLLSAVWLSLLYPATAWHGAAIGAAVLGASWYRERRRWWFALIGSVPALLAFRDWLW